MGASWPSAEVLRMVSMSGACKLAWMILFISSSHLPKWVIFSESGLMTRGLWIDMKDNIGVRDLFLTISHKIFIS